MLDSTVGAVEISGAVFGPSNLPILLSRVRCSGTESSLLECNWSATATSSCTHAQDVGVQCQGM